MDFWRRGVAFRVGGFSFRAFVESWEFRACYCSTSSCALVRILEFEASSLLGSRGGFCLLAASSVAGRPQRPLLLGLGCGWLASLVLERSMESWIIPLR